MWKLISRRHDDDEAEKQEREEFRDSPSIWISTEKASQKRVEFPLLERNVEMYVKFIHKNEFSMFSSLKHIIECSSRGSWLYDGYRKSRFDRERSLTRISMRCHVENISDSSFFVRKLHLMRKSGRSGWMMMTHFPLQGRNQSLTNLWKLHGAHVSPNQIQIIDAIWYFCSFSNLLFYSTLRKTITQLNIPMRKRFFAVWWNSFQLKKQMKETKLTRQGWNNLKFIFPSKVIWNQRLIPKLHFDWQFDFHLF